MLILFHRNAHCKTSKLHLDGELYYFMLLQVPMQPKMRAIPFKATGDTFQDETNGMHAFVCLFRRSKHRYTKRFDQ